MTGPVQLGAELLRDAGALERLDGGRFFPAVAATGAQVRAVAEQTAGLHLDRPRALLVVGDTAEQDTAVLAALLGPAVPVPVLAAPGLPGWVGALDLVVVLAGGRGDVGAAAAADQARRRGATVLVRAAADGPVAAAAGPALLPVRLAAPETLAGPGRWALLTAVAQAAGLASGCDLSAAADRLDAAVAALRPAGDSFTNPAVNLAEHLAGGAAVLLGTDPVAEAVADAGARILADLGGVLAGVLTSTRLAGGSALAGLLTPTGTDLFADPFDDPGPVRPAPVLVTVPGAADPRRVSALRAAFPRAFELTAAGAQDATPTPTPTPTDRFAAAAGLIAQLGAAAAALALIGGHTSGMDTDGLGSTGGSRWAVQPERPAAGSPAGDDQEFSTWN